MTHEERRYLGVSAIILAAIGAALLLADASPVRVLILIAMLGAVLMSSPISARLQYRKQRRRATEHHHEGPVSIEIKRHSAGKLTITVTDRETVAEKPVGRRR